MSTQLNFFQSAAIAEPAQLTLEDCIQLSQSKETTAMTQFATSTTVAARPKELEGLGHFTGTEHYYKIMFGYKLTDGMKHVCETAHAYWLTDVIVSHAMAHKNQDMLACKLVVDDLSNACTFTMTDGDDIVLATQEIPYTDFPVLTFTAWVVDGVIMLPSEY